MSEQSRNEEARRAMFAAIREHLAASTPHDAVRAGHHAAAHGEGVTTHGEDVSARAVPEAVAAGEIGGTVVERFRHALEAVAGRCFVVRDEAEAAEVLRQIVEQRNSQRVAVSDSPLAGRVLKLAALPAEVLENAPAESLFDCDLGVTGAQWGVAETGTLVLESDAERHRLASLVPAAHVAIIEARNVRQTLGEVLRAVGERGADALSRALTFITGPSRTSDIELTLAIGVHGPGELYVIIVGEV
ncbi:MAG TPA: lactate utilization protein [Pyrinomonadaceae bacterium]|nr:lactate utilization protein [Pyrinomonadaceae bacterium]